MIAAEVMPCRVGALWPEVGHSALKAITRRSFDLLFCPP